MPLVLAPEAWPQWLGEEAADEAQLKALLAPNPSEGMIAWPVSARVGNGSARTPRRHRRTIARERIFRSVS
jgi:putative SOS response-associated peptidase YedK